MELSQNDQVKFTKEVLAILDCKALDAKQLSHLKEIVSLINGWTNGNSGIIGYLDEYIHEVIASVDGNDDAGWRDEFRKKIELEIGALY